MIGIQISITPTDQFAEVEGAPCRVWRGRTSLGVECLVFVRGIGVVDDDETDTTEFDTCLQPTGPALLARGGRRDGDEEEDR